jgi:hypothetical protein
MSATADAFDVDNPSPMSVAGDIAAARPAPVAIGTPMRCGSPLPRNFGDD